MNFKIAVIGLGYVGLPVALAFARKFPNTIGFDINERKVNDLKNGYDETGEIESDILKSTSLHFTTSTETLKDINFFVVAVPTPIDNMNNPNLRPVQAASETIGKVLSQGSIVVYESTVYPGVTEEVCGPILEKVSGLKQGVDFKLGYSPERINPGDKEHTLERIIKVVSGEDTETLDRIATVYEAIIDAGVHRATSIKVAEAAKVIENTQRDLNIALMNELALIFDKLNIRTQDVLEAAKTKWNFLPFTPGLVGGHCIGVDPYYLTSKAEEMGYHPQVILAGRRINDGMGAFIAQKALKLLIQQNKPVQNAKVSILGLTFKENVPDLRNSRVPDIIQELKEFNITPIIHDPLAEQEDAYHEYGITLNELTDIEESDVLILAVPHQKYLDSWATLLSTIKGDAIIIDVKSVIEPTTLASTLTYWSL